MRRMQRILRQSESVKMVSSNRKGDENELENI